MVKKRKDSSNNKKNPDKNSKIVGFGGWLILIQIGLIIGLILYFITGISFLGDKGNNNSLIFGILFLILTSCYGYTIFLMYSKNKKFPNFAILILWLTFGIYLLLNNGFGNETFGILVGAILWTFYFRKSKRVKNTFR